MPITQTIHFPEISGRPFKAEPTVANASPSFFLFLVLENYFYLRCQFMTRVHIKLASSKFCSNISVLNRKIARFGSNLCSWNPFSNFSCPSPNVYSPLCERFTFVWDCNQVRNLLLKSFYFLTGYFTHFISKAQYLNSIFDNSDMQFFVMGLFSSLTSASIIYKVGT